MKPAFPHLKKCRQDSASSWIDLGTAMPRRKQLAQAVLVAVLLLTYIIQPTRHVRAAKVRRPNILVIITDDQRAAGTLGVMPKTRRFLKAGGAVYQNAFTASGACCASRATVFTGQYPHNHRVVNNQSAAALDQSTTIQAHLMDNGYRTALAGKFLNNFVGPPPYFDKWAAHAGGGYYYGGTWNINGNKRRVDDYSTDFISRMSLRFLNSFENDDSRPWFLYVAPMAPHGPSTPEREYAKARVGAWDGNAATRESNLSDKPAWVREEVKSWARAQKVRRRHLRTLMSVDDLVGALRRRMGALGETRRTLVIFTSDSGHLWGEHRLVQKSNPYTQAVKIPLLMRWPGRIEPGFNRTLVGNIDLAPTIAEAARLPASIATGMDGRSLFGFGGHVRLLVHNPGRRAFSSRALRYQYVEYFSDEGLLIEDEYYNLLRDPWQLYNRLGDKKPGNDPDVATLGAQLAQDRTCSGATCP